jgi:sigma-70-like protein
VRPVCLAKYIGIEDLLQGRTVDEGRLRRSRANQTDLGFTSELFFPEAPPDAMSPALTQSDEAQTRRACAQADDTHAFAELYDRHAHRALRIARSICGDESRAEDAVEAGFLTIWRIWADYRPDAGSFQAWSMRFVTDRRPRGVARLPATALRGPGRGARPGFFGRLSHAEIAAQLDFPRGPSRPGCA